MSDNVTRISDDALDTLDRAMQRVRDEPGEWESSLVILLNRKDQSFNSACLFGGMHYSTVVALLALTQQRLVTEMLTMREDDE